MTLLIAGCAPAASTTDPDQEIAPSGPLAATTLPQLAVELAGLDATAPRKATYLRPLQRLTHQCSPGSVDELERDVERLAQGLKAARVVPAPRAVALAALAAAAGRDTDCRLLAVALLAETVQPVPATKSGWGGYAGTLAAWRATHRPDPARPGSYLPRLTATQDAFQLTGTSRVFTLVERSGTPLTAQLALVSIEHSLLPAHVHVVYSLKAAQCQQAIFMGHGLGRLFGNGSLGAFVELSSGKGVGRTPYDAKRVNRARITPLGRIGGQPCS